LATSISLLRFPANYAHSETPAELDDDSSFFHLWVGRSGYSHLFHPLDERQVAENHFSTYRKLKHV
jgi:hypothetical protein